MEIQSSSEKLDADRDRTFLPQDKNTNEEYKIFLPMFLNDCPSYWKNFKEVNFPDVSNISRTDVDATLIPYGGRIERSYENENLVVLIFNTEADFIIFKLRWS